ncbi:MAG: 16S rRNA (cytosine(967)-C(5))-methyltransferase RsmB [Lachnospiraceae bacterium]|nr:16S rRNA (cytosine(967)-C(5))-methyltransferase RsmB [Lachnospiraceae bacterium]
MTEINVREVVLDIMLELSKQTEYSNILIASVLSKYDYLDSRQKAFIKRVGEGTIERRIQIDYVLDRFSKVPVKKMKPFIRELLRMSVYQLLFMDGIPDAAVCNEAVKLAKKHRFQSLQGYVNGVLRTVARQKEQIVYPDKQTSYIQYMSVCYSMPDWLVEHFCNAYGREACETILQSFMKRGAVGIRLQETIDTQQRENLIGLWQQAGVQVNRHPYLPYAVEVQKADGIHNLAGFDEGLFAVQDVSSMLVVEAAGIKKSDTVIDVCAAPGGKALHAAVKLAGTGQVIACDVSSYKTDKIRENMERLQMTNVSVREQDARVRDETLVGQADVLITDVPCSGLGVIGKKQDIKYRVTKESMRDIVGLQKEIVANVIHYLKSDGVMMYSTCTMNPSENEEMVDWICREYDMEPESMAQTMPEELREEAGKGYIQLLPGIHGTDGFFIARLRRKTRTLSDKIQSMDT